MLLPSAIQRSDDLVGIVTPTSAPALDPPPPAAGACSVVFWLDPQAVMAVASTMLPAKAASRANFMLSPSSRIGGTDSTAAGQALGQPVVRLVPPDVVREPGRGAV